MNGTVKRLVVLPMDIVLQISTNRLGKRGLEEVSELPQHIRNGPTAILPIEAKPIWRRSFFSEDAGRRYEDCRVVTQKYFFFTQFRFAFGCS
jgi:hypothetical protein